MARRTLKYVETEGGPFVLLPKELVKRWRGVGDEDEETDYDRANEFLSSLGVLDVGDGQALVLGEAEVTAFMAAPDGGVFVQRVYGDDDAAVVAAVEKACASGRWKTRPHTLAVTGSGKLLLFDAAYAYADVDKDEVLRIALAPGTYTLQTRRVSSEAIEVGLVRLCRRE